MAQAKKYDSEIAKGIWRGPLHGVPIGLKDLCYTTFAPTAGGTKIHAKFVPPFNATIVDRLERAGAVTLGKLKMTEGAYTSHHPDDQAPLNPWNAELLGRVLIERIRRSDLGRALLRIDRKRHRRLDQVSIRDLRADRNQADMGPSQPIWRFSRWRTRSIMSDRCVEVRQMPRRCWASSQARMRTIRRLCSLPFRIISPGSSDGVRGLKIGVDRKYTQEGVDAQVVAALLEAERTLADLGAEIREVKFPSYEKLVSQWIPMCSVETAEAHLETYPSRKSEYGPDLAQLIEQGRSVSGVEIAAIHHERLKFSGSLAALFGDVDLLLVPTMPMPIPTLARMSEYGADPGVLLNILRFTAVFDFSGSPTITLPMGMASDHMPLSMQLVGPHLSEEVLRPRGTCVSVGDRLAYAAASYFMMRWLRVFVHVFVVQVDGIAKRAERSVLRVAWPIRYGRCCAPFRVPILRPPCVSGMSRPHSGSCGEPGRVSFRMPFE